MFSTSIITPERAVYSGDTTSAVVPAHDGEIGFLTHRAPMLVRLGVGTLRLKTDDGDLAFYVDGGFAEMVDDQLTVLTEDAIPAADLGRAQAESELTEALDLPAQTVDEVTARDQALARAKAKVKLAG